MHCARLVVSSRQCRRLSIPRCTKIASSSSRPSNQQHISSHQTRFLSSVTMADQRKHSTHPDFKTLEASRPDWDVTTAANGFHYTKTASPDWKYGQGRNDLADTGANRPHVAIDPHAEGRPAGLNYVMLISAVTPRPIAFVSTRSADGTTTNLAPFSYFNIVTHDPPTFMISIASGVDNAKDTLKNLLETGECVINIISETFLEAANAASIDAPFGKDEWRVSGLTPDYSCETVKCARVKEAVFSVEAKLESFKEWESRARPGQKSGTSVFVEGTRFWVREDALNETKSSVDLSILRPLGRLGGISYSRTNQGVELQRPSFQNDLGGEEGYNKLPKSKV